MGYVPLPPPPFKKQDVRIARTNCVNCGAPVNLKTPEKCAYCGTWIAQPKEEIIIFDLAGKTR